MSSLNLIVKKVGNTNFARTYTGQFSPLAWLLILVTLLVMVLILLLIRALHQLGHSVSNAALLAVRVSCNMGEEHKHRLSKKIVPNKK